MLRTPWHTINKINNESKTVKQEENSCKETFVICWVLTKMLSGSIFTLPPSYFHSWRPAAFEMRHVQPKRVGSIT